MSKPYRSNPITMHLACNLRKELTPTERKLWARLRRSKLNGMPFRKQHAIGNYIVDFCSIKGKLVIELDGSQHTKQHAYDAERTAYLKSLGFKVIRFWNSQVMNDIEGVILAIRKELGAPSRPPPNPKH